MSNLFRPGFVLKTDKPADEQTKKAYKRIRLRYKAAIQNGFTVEDCAKVIKQSRKWITPRAMLKRALMGKGLSERSKKTILDSYFTDTRGDK